MTKPHSNQVAMWKGLKLIKTNGITLRDYQIDIAYEAAYKLSSLRICYLAMQMRTGKTLTALACASVIYKRNSNVLFVTKKKAIGSIESDAKLLVYEFDLTIINYESLHKIPRKQYDLVICDEAHSCFLGSTLINGHKIKDIKVGSFQKSFNFAKNKYEEKKVLNVFKNELSENLVKIKCNGKEIVCTESHKIFTKRGWIKAGEILPTDELQVV